MAYYNTEKVRNYILEVIDLEGSNQEKLNAVYERYFKNFQLNLSSNWGKEYSLFIDWMQAIPGIFDVEIRTYEQGELLKSWGVNPNVLEEDWQAFYKIVRTEFFEYLADVRTEEMTDEEKGVYFAFLERDGDNSPEALDHYEVRALDCQNVLSGEEVEGEEVEELWARLWAEEFEEFDWMDKVDPEDYDYQVSECIEANGKIYFYEN